MNRLLMGIALLLLAALVAAGCGDDDGASKESTSSDTAMEKTDDAMEKSDDAMGKSDDAMEKTDGAMEKVPAKVTTRTRPGALTAVHDQAMIQAAGSEFGTVLWDQYGQVVYAFESDKPGVSNCYGECADFWPPVLTKADAAAMTGVDQSKLGTTKRKDGSLQVTYNGWPLYYMNEPAGEIQCHNHELHGGLWWVIAPNGNPVKTGKS